MHLVIVGFINCVNDFLLRTFSDAGSSQGTGTTIFSCASIFSGQMTIVAFNLLEKNLLTLRTAIVVFFLMIGESFAFRFVFSEVRNVAGDLMAFQCFKCLATAIACIGYDLFYL